MTPHIYLAGPISGLTYKDATDWREEISRLLPPAFVLLSPLRGKQYLRGMEAMPKFYNGHPLSTSKGIVSRDGWDVTRCDAVVANLKGAPEASIGTCWELGVAWAERKPVITILDPETEPIHLHPMILESSSFLVPTLENAADLLKSLFWEEYGTDPQYLRESKKEKAYAL